MKEIKPHEERFFKDIVLNSILEEISNEQGKPLQDLIPSESKKNTKRRIGWFSFVSLFIIALAAFFIPLIIKVTEPMQTSHLTAQDNVKEPKETTNIHKKQLSELKIQAKDDSLLIVSQNTAETSTETTQLNEHEIAKAQLLEQMKH